MSDTTEVASASDSLRDILLMKREHGDNFYFGGDSEYDSVS